VADALYMFNAAETSPLAIGLVKARALINIAAPREQAELEGGRQDGPSQPQPETKPVVAPDCGLSLGMKPRSLSAGRRC